MFPATQQKFSEEGNQAYLSISLKIQMAVIEHNFLQFSFARSKIILIYTSLTYFIVLALFARLKKGQ